MEKVLITGISGEVGHGLIKKLYALGYKPYALDLNAPEKEIADCLEKFYQGDITDRNLVDSVFDENNFDIIFHLASILSTGGEKNPELASKVNITGTLNLMENATASAIKNSKPIKFIFPSSIAAHGDPITIYGVSKLACENLGRYFSKNYKLLDTSINRNNLIDFRCVRFPGLLSPDTVPSGGTSDYGPEMLHAAAQNKAYECFVREDSTIPFMAMADAAEILYKLATVEKNKLTKEVYEVGGFSVSAKQIYEMTKKYFPEFQMTYKVNEERQKIVDSWPKSVESTDAEHDWGYKLNYDFEKTFSEYLIPKIKERYQALGK